MGKILFKIEIVAKYERGWYWRLKSMSNKRVIAQSNPYTSKDMCLKTAALVGIHLQFSQIVEVK